MPNLTNNFYNLTNNIKTKHYIETGAYLGDGIRCVLNKYENIHSIELSEKWYSYNVEQFKNEQTVKMYLGDSKKILPELLDKINEPLTIYLDAHYSGGTTAFGEEETPLLFELEIWNYLPKTVKTEIAQYVLDFWVYKKETTHKDCKFIYDFIREEKIKANSIDNAFAETDYMSYVEM